jgi:uncharacterized protein (TIGR02300 family)
MPAPALGVKRRCLTCTAPFFDLNKSPIACPKCGAAFQVIALPRHLPGMRARAQIPMPASPVAQEEQVEATTDEASDENNIPEVEEDDETDLGSIADIDRDDESSKHHA